jgi:hypothetical protein
MEMDEAILIHALLPLPIAHCPLPIAHCPLPTETP